MLMTILQKGKHRIRLSFVICFRGAITFPQTGRCTEVRLELYTDLKDLEAEQNVEDVLDAAGIFYNKSETWIDSEKLYEVLYVFEMPTDGEGAGKTGNEMKEVGNVYEEK